MVTVLHVLGATNAGKTTFLDQMVDIYGDRVRRVEIGKILRAKYLDPDSPHFEPDKFKGQSNPKETADEAWKLYLDLVNEATNAEGVEIVLVDGQPRDVEQAEAVMNFVGVNDEIRIEFILVHADHEKRAERLAQRFDDEHDPGFRLGLARMESDYRGLYDVLAVLASHGIVPKVLDTSEAPIGPEGVERVRGVCPTVWSMFNAEAV